MLRNRLFRISTGTQRNQLTEKGSLRTRLPLPPPLSLLLHARPPRGASHLRRKRQPRIRSPAKTRRRRRLAAHVFRMLEGILKSQCPGLVSKATELRETRRKWRLAADTYAETLKIQRPVITLYKGTMRVLFRNVWVRRQPARCACGGLRP